MALPASNSMLFSEQGNPCTLPKTLLSQNERDSEALEILQTEYAAMRDILARIDQRLDEVHLGLQCTQSDLQMTMQNNAELHQESVSALADLSLANFQVSSLRRHNHTLEQDNIRIVAEAAVMREQIDDLQYANLQLRNQATVADMTVAGLEAELISQSSQLFATEAHAEGVEVALQHARFENSTLVDELASLSQAIESSLKKNHNLSSQVYHLERKAHAKDQENKHLIRSYDAMHETLRLVTEGMDVALEQVHKLEFEKAKKDRDHDFEVNKLLRYARESDMAVTGLEVQMNGQQSQLKEAKRLYGKSRKENAALRESLKSVQKKQVDGVLQIGASRKRVDDRTIWRRYWA